MKIYLRRSGFLRINVSSDTGAWPTHLAAHLGSYPLFLDIKTRAKLVVRLRRNLTSLRIISSEKAYVRLFSY